MSPYSSPVVDEILSSFKESEKHYLKRVLQHPERGHEDDMVRVID